MDFTSANYCFPQAASRFLSGDGHVCTKLRSPKFSTIVVVGYGSKTKALASRKQTKKLRNHRNTQKRDKDLPQQTLDENDDVNRPNSIVNAELGNKAFDSNTLEVSNSALVPARSDVLQACTVTSGLIGALGVLIRLNLKILLQVALLLSAYFAHRIKRRMACCGLFLRYKFYLENPASAAVSFQVWHLELIMGTVILVSSCRFLLLKIWLDFGESSQAANQQVLTSLEPLDYLLVSFLPGISEELLFRGAILPLLGISNWISIYAVAALFGVLHLGTGRKYSFAIWATFVGIIYGYVTALSSSMCVPMACHALNNLVGGIMWRCSSKSSEQNR